MPLSTFNIIATMSIYLFYLKILITVTHTSLDISVSLNSTYPQLTFILLSHLRLSHKILDHYPSILISMKQLLQGSFRNLSPGIQIVVCCIPCMAGAKSASYCHSRCGCTDCPIVLIHIKQLNNNNRKLFWNSY